MTIIANAPFPTFLNLDGAPLEDGYLYFGYSNQNPETNPITVYWDGDFTTPAAQPIRTSGGYPIRDGSPANMFVSATDYSITVRDKNRRLVYSNLFCDLSGVGVSQLAVADIFTGDGTTTVYTLSDTPASLSGLDVSIGGVVQTPGVDYTLVNGTDQITFTSPPPNGASILVRFGRANEALAQISYNTQPLTATAGQTLFNLNNAYTPGANTLAVYLNGLRLRVGFDYTETSTTQITLTAGAVAGDELLFVTGTTEINPVSITASAVAYTPAGTGAVATDVQSRLRVMSTKIFAGDPRFAGGVKADGVTNDYAALIAIRDYVLSVNGSGGGYDNWDSQRGVAVEFPAGVVLNDTGLIDFEDSIVTLVGQGIGHTVFKAGTNFSGTGFFRFGRESVSTLTLYVAARDFVIDMNNKTGWPIAAFGIRDGSHFFNIVISDFITGAVKLAESSTGGASVQISEGVHFNNIHALTRRVLTDVPFRIDGSNEIAFTNCKFIGSYLPDMTSQWVVKVGQNRICYGVRFEGCSFANVKHETNPDPGNGGIKFYQVQDCWSIANTFEGIGGAGVCFGDASSSTYESINCWSIADRFYNPSLVNSGYVVKEWVVFERALGCRAQMRQISTSAVSDKIVYFKTNATNCHADVISSETNFSNITLGGTNCAVTAWINGRMYVANQGSGRIVVRGHSHAASTTLEDDSLWSTLRTNSNNQFRLTNSDISKTLFRAINTIPTNQSGVAILFNLDGVEAIRTVQVGAADSGGVGFRSLRVAN